MSEIRCKSGEYLSFTSTRISPLTYSYSSSINHDQNKVLINSLTMVAEDHAESMDSAKKIYDCIRGQLLAANGDYKLPIMYVIDSILKNAKGCYIGFFEDDASSWMGSVYRSLPNETTRSKLKKVYKTWNDFSLFPLDKWKAMGECFNDDNDDTGSRSPRSSDPSGAGTVAGIPRSVSIYYI